MTDNFEGYTMRHQAPDLERARCDAFMRHELSTNEIYVLMQDVTESGLLAQLPPAFYVCAAHCAERSLITLNGRLNH